IAAAEAAIELAFLIVGQLAQIGEILQAPRLVVMLDDIGIAEVETAGGGLIFFFFDEIGGLLHKLKRADAVAVIGADELAAGAPAIAAIELAGGDEAELLAVEESAGGGLEKPPILGMGQDHGFAIFVDLIGPAQALQAVDGKFQVLHDFFGIALGIEREL